MPPTGLHTTTLAAAALVAATSLGCELPVEPGSDLPDAAPAATLGPRIDTGADVAAEAGADITGEFDLRATVTSEFDDREITIPMLALPDQSGEIGDEAATVSLELRAPETPDQPGASTEEPAAIDDSGAFQATVPGYTIPAASSEMLEADTEADVVLDAQIVDADCFRGDTTITMYDLEVSGSTVPELVLEGGFEAARQGTTCEQTGPSADAGHDVLESGD